MQEFRDFLADWMRRNGRTFSDLERATGVNNSVIGRWLREKPKRPTPENLAKLAPVVGVSYEELLRMCGYLPSEAAHQAAQRKVDVELQHRMVLMQGLLDAGYPKGMLLSVLDANYAMAKQATPTSASNPVAPTSRNHQPSELPKGDDGEEDGRNRPFLRPRRVLAGVTG